MAKAHGINGKGAAARRGVEPGASTTFAGRWGRRSWRSTPSAGEGGSQFQVTQRPTPGIDPRPRLRVTQTDDNRLAVPHQPLSTAPGAIHPFPWQKWLICHEVSDGIGGRWLRPEGARRTLAGVDVDASVILRKRYSPGSARPLGWLGLVRVRRARLARPVGAPSQNPVERRPGAVQRQPSPQSDQCLRRILRVLLFPSQNQARKTRTPCGSPKLWRKRKPWRLSG